MCRKMASFCLTLVSIHLNHAITDFETRRLCIWWEFSCIFLLREYKTMASFCLTLVSIHLNHAITDFETRRLCIWWEFSCIFLLREYRKMASFASHWFPYTSTMQLPILRRGGFLYGGNSHVSSH